MKANELRIGNLVMYDNYNVSVIHGLTDSEYGYGVSIHYGNCCVGCVEDLIYPIPLTEEWLLKLGFEKINSTWCSIGNQFRINIDLNIEFHLNWLGIKVQYVHQLQNLYFALTGKEMAMS